MGVQPAAQMTVFPCNALSRISRDNDQKHEWMRSIIPTVSKSALLGDEHSEAKAKIYQTMVSKREAKHMLYSLRNWDKKP